MDKGGHILNRQTLSLLAVLSLVLSCSKILQQSQRSGSASKEPVIPAVENVKPEEQVNIQPENNPSLRIAEKDYHAFLNLMFDESSYSSLISQVVNSFYKINGHKTLWLGAKAPGKIFSVYMEVRDHIWKDGLQAKDYKFKELQQAVDEAYVVNDTRSLVALDYQITYSFFLLSHHMAYGKTNPRRLDSLWFVDERVVKVYSAEDLHKLASGEDLDAYFEKIRPPHRQYVLLMDKLIELKSREPVNDTAMEGMELLTNLRKGDKGEKVLKIRERLAIEDPSLVETKDPMLFDQALQQAVLKFQRRFGLEADGIVGPQTRHCLRKPVEEEIEKIRLNMERIRWMPRTFGGDYLVVNVPDYSLKLFENGKEKLQMKVIVGRVMNKTPIFSDTLEYIVFSPTWVIPQSIKVKEMLPRLQEDSACFSDRDYIFYESWTSKKEVDPREVDWSKIDSTNFKYNIVQQPGPGNALGRVKFMMPNDFYIYLHDTPEDHLFSQKDRDFSHGCIRVEQPMELARHLVDDQFFFPEKKINQLACKDEPQKVVLQKNYHVQIMYRTAWVDEKGTLQHRKDIYKLDDVQLRLLNK